jgi:hypothetical protein
LKGERGREREGLEGKKVMKKKEQTASSFRFLWISVVCYLSKNMYLRRKAEAIAVVKPKWISLRDIDEATLKPSQKRKRRRSKWKKKMMMI